MSSDLADQDSANKDESVKDHEGAEKKGEFEVDASLSPATRPFVALSKEDIAAAKREKAQALLQGKLVECKQQCDLAVRKTDVPTSTSKPISLGRCCGKCMH